MSILVQITIARVFLYQISYFHFLGKYIICGKFESSNVLYITPTYTSSM